MDVLKFSDLDLDFYPATEKDFAQVRSLCSDERHYMSSIYHSWLQERNRVVILAKCNRGVVGMSSAHIVNDGQTALMEGLQVAASERGKGIARLVHKHILERVRARYPEVKRQCYLTQHEYFKGFSVLSKQCMVFLRFPSINVPALISEAIGNMKKSGDEYYEAISLQPDDVRSIFLNRTVIDTILPGGRIIQRGSVFKPLESNLDILLKRDIVWRADSVGNTRVVSVGTAPFKDPMGNYIFIIDMFGTDLPAVKRVFLSQLQSLPHLQGDVLCRLSVNPSLSPQMWEFCTKKMGLEKRKQYLKNSYVIEGDIFQTIARL
ncbi:histidine N-acetyltransferase-like [Carcharodon carcharias]|uniref:histidine N-acetyltransferase-like n=1 Tax=Carcharodon carcharias TaxID=13397 RepID=UPI001B7E5449|nr:histidine N-acetyltransferase-like [Carcharodon carcharias]